MEVGTPTNFLALELRPRARMERHQCILRNSSQSNARALPYPLLQGDPQWSMQMQLSRGSRKYVAGRCLISSCDFALSDCLPHHPHHLHQQRTKLRVGLGWFGCCSWRPAFLLFLKTFLVLQ